MKLSDRRSPGESFEQRTANSEQRPRAVLFDLLTALLDSWSLWNRVIGSDQQGRRWRTRYLDLAYGAGAYRSCEGLMRQAAIDCGFGPDQAEELIGRWDELEPWPEARGVLATLRGRVPLGVVTNCSVELGEAALAKFEAFDVTVIAEEVGYYKPRPEPYLAGLRQLGFEPPEVVFVAGSPGDVGGASEVGMPVYWHNRRGLGLPAGSPEPACNEPTLSPLSGWVQMGASE